MTSEAVQNPYFVRLYCKNIAKTHSLTEPNDKIQFHGNYFFKKGGGETTLERGGGEPTPCSPPKSALEHVPETRIFHHVLVKYHSTINYNMYILIILLSLWTVFITSHHRLHRYSSHATSDSSPATMVNVTPPRSFQLSILLKQCREYNIYGHISSQICSPVYKKYAFVLPDSVDHDLYELILIRV